MTVTVSEQRTATGRRRRDELAAFLRSRRERITPEDVGLPPAPRRRTPGLRREEVAQLAGVGVTWYTWLEQGRPINVSTQVLDAISRTLRLDTVEREHLYRLSEVAVPPEPDIVSALSEDVRTILTALEPMPAVVSNARSDALTWNDAYSALFPAVTEAPEGERNSMWQFFTLPSCCNPCINLDEQVAESVAMFRYRYVRHRDDPEFQRLVERLVDASPRFDELWRTQDVAVPQPCQKDFYYPRVGKIATRTTSFDLSVRPGTRMVVYTYVDEASRKNFMRLLKDPSLARPDHTH
ncbi:helix-turn-helix transcriptional regulator [Actinomadura rupiterrae]|uniref:helix-turn-helix transcriptional regulator n=1 Tax=Actinomadura rupiterrae TaxID=559627 RepID=UPI0020A43825|nr:helix-turn-helix transcriptional regulator [Actinomadura rupiterrae]MCP2341673.1 transcriptional regulator with XRE-family HTH domain [Actinomadura rupiterrae]